MNISQGQATIIKSICKIQSDSVLRIVTTDDFSIQHSRSNRMMKELGLDKKDLEEPLTNYMIEFDKLSENVDNFYTLSLTGTLVLSHIHMKMGYMWDGLYPNAYANLRRLIDARLQLLNPIQNQYTQN